MKDYQLNKHTLQFFLEEIQLEIEESTNLVVSTQAAGTGKWGMAKLWRAWMSSTAKWMADRGAVMPLMIKKDGLHYGERPFNAGDAHELFTAQWLGVDEDGKRLSWSKSGRDDMRAATKSERFFAMLKHENWATEKGIVLMQPRDSEFAKLKDDGGY